ncbi:MAG: glycosyltransferase [Candidatus Falkowbacteria bacterium]
MNNPKWLVISSSTTPISPLDNLLRDLGKKGFIFELLYNHNQNLSTVAIEEHWQSKLTWLGPKKDGVLKKLFYLCWPVLLIITFVKYFWLWRKNTNGIILFGSNEKLLYTLPARLLGQKVIWLILPEEIVHHRGVLLKLLSKKVRCVICNSSTEATATKLGIAPEQTTLLQPGIIITQTHQDNLFHELAQHEHSTKKFFTIGTVTDLNQRQQIESLFQAAKRAVQFVPNLQLIVVGEGTEKKNLQWLAKKMEIDGFVWLVGEQGHLRKWLESLDIYLAASDNLTMAEISKILYVMASGRPVIGPTGIGLEDIIFTEKTGYTVNLSDSETLAEKIVILQQKKELRQAMSRAARERVEKYFTSAKMIAQFEKLISE